MDDELELIQVPVTNDLEERVANTFEVFDHLGNNTIEVGDTGTVVRALGCCPTEEQVKDIVKEVENPDVPGTVHLQDFMPFICKKIMDFEYKGADADQLLKAFRVLDSEGRGYVTKEYISTIMVEYGEKFTQDEVDEMLDVALDPHYLNIPYEFYINQLENEPEGEKDIYTLGARILEENPPPPPPPPPKRLSEFLAATAAETILT